MLGLEMMLKSLGLDPEQLKKQVVEMGRVVLEFQASINAIHSDLQLIKQHLGIQGESNGRDTGRTEFGQIEFGGSTGIAGTSESAGTKR